MIAQVPGNCKTRTVAQLWNTGESFWFPPTVRNVPGVRVRLPPYPGRGWYVRNYECYNYLRLIDWLASHGPFFGYP